MDSASRNRYAAGGAIIFAALLFGGYKVFNKKADCFADPSAKIAFLIDRSEPITTLQVREIHERIRKELGSAPPNARVTVYHMTDRGFDASSVFEKCLPKLDINPIYEGDAKLARNKFNRFIEEVISSVKTADIKIELKSPIIETIDTIMTKSGLNRDGTNLKRDQVSLHVFSDLIQNSSLVSLYGCNGKLSKNLADMDGISERLQRFSNDGAQITLHIVRRDHANPSIPSLICQRSFWENLLPRAEHRPL